VVKGIAYGGVIDAVMTFLLKKGEDSTSEREKNPSKSKTASILQVDPALLLLLRAFSWRRLLA
jgi:hypothetical protein